VSTGELVSNPQ